MQFKIAEGEGLQLVSKVLEKEALCYDDLNQFNGEIVEVYDEIGDLNGFYGLEICHEDVILRSVVILQSFRKKGLGHKIVDHAIQNATRKNLRTMYLLTTTAENFFAKIGFEVTDGFYSGIFWMNSPLCDFARDFMEVCRHTGFCAAAPNQSRPTKVEIRYEEP